MSNIKTAPVNMFTTLRSPLFGGQLLKDIKTVQASIQRYGLLAPILVSKANGQLVVVDGRKRLAAIRRLNFMGKLPRSLVNIPYVEIETVGISEPQTPALMSNRELYLTVIAMFRQTQDVGHIATELYLSGKCVREILTLSRLSPRIRRAFFERTIDLNAAKAYAAFPGHAQQDKAFLALGPFADVADILDYFAAPKVDTTLRLVA